MRKHLFAGSFFAKVALSGLLVTTFFSSCEKNENLKSNVTDSSSSTKSNVTPDSSLIKFLSISLNVKKSEITFDDKKSDYVIRGLRFNKTDIDSTYKKANVYQLKYGK
jgi:hypothetical protein